MNNERGINKPKVLVEPLTVSVTDLDAESDSGKYSEKSLAPTVSSHSHQLLLKMKGLGEAKDFLLQGLWLLRD